MGKKVKTERGILCYYRDESKMINTPVIVITSMPVVILLTAGSFIVCAFLTFVKDMYFTPLTNTLLGVGCIGVAWGIFTEKFFNWFEHCRYIVRDGKLLYQYDLNSKVIGVRDASVSIEIKSVSKFKVRGRTAKLRGVFIKKTPTQSNRKLKNLTVQIDFAEKECIINHIKERMSK